MAERFANLRKRLGAIAVALLAAGLTACDGSSDQVRIAGWEPLGLVGEEIESISIDPKNPNRLLAGSWGLVGQDAFESADGGAHWKPSTRRLRREGEIADPNSPGTTYTLTGQPDTVVSKSTNGRDWVPLSIGGRRASLGWPTSVALDTSRAQTLYAAVTEHGANEVWIFKSTTGGDTWTTVAHLRATVTYTGVGLTLPLQVTALAVDPSGSKVYAGTNGEGVYVCERCAKAESSPSPGALHPAAPAQSVSGKRPSKTEGPLIAFTRGDELERDIYVVGRDGRGERRLTTHPATEFAHLWSPDGRQLLFKRGLDVSDLMVVDVDGTGLRRLVTNSGNELLAPESWSPDGRKILFVSDRAGFWHDLYVINADGSKVRRLTGDQSDDVVMAEWSPDGRRILFDRAGTVGVMNADGSKVRRLPEANPGGLTLITLAWSPTGRQILFEDFDGAGCGYLCFTSDIVLINADGTGRRNLTNNPKVLEADSAMSPDGKRVVFEREGDLWVIDVFGKGLRNLTRTRVRESEPEWSPDGREIAFVSHGEKRGDSDIYVMGADGSGRRRVTRSPKDDEAPAWQPLPPKR